MIKVTPEAIKKLREATQAPMADCKKALEENENDIEKSIKWLREKGILKAAKKAGNIAANGCVNVVTKDNKAIIYEVNCQTDFTSLNEKFTKLVKDIGAALLSSNLKTDANADNIKINSTETIKDACIALTAITGENIKLRRFNVIDKTSNDSFGIYVHFNFRKAAVIILSGSKATNAANDIALHAVGMNAEFASIEQVDPKWLANEKQILIETTIAEGKPKERAEQIVAGRINKLLAEKCLTEQDFIKDPSLKVKEFASKNNGTITKLIKYEVGEGIEQVTTDFAAEVQQQINSAKKN